MNDWHLPTYQENLAIFVGELRDQLFSSQEETAAYFCLDRGQISRYESGKSTPKLGYLAGLAQLMAKRSDNDPQIQAQLLQEVNRAIKRHYRKGKFRDWPALSKAADDYLKAQHDRKIRKSTSKAASFKNDWQAKLDQRLDLPPATELIGVEDNLNRLYQVITSTKAPWVVCIDGTGGIGKTSLANALVRQPPLANHFQGVAWISAKKQSFIPGKGLQPIPEPVLSAEALVDSMLTQLGNTVSLAQPPSQKKAALTELLKHTPYLITVDNLETIEDYETILPTLLKLTHPSKVLLTSRVSLRTHSDVFTLTLDELDRSTAIQLIRYEAETRNLPTILNAPDTYFQDVYEVVGGNPLALKLLVGQMSVLALNQILKNLKKAKGKDIQDLYNFLYWQAWHLLSLTSQQVFLAMPLAPHGTIEQLTATTQLDAHEVSQALQQLAELSLVQVKGDDLYERRYSVHSLTETFLLSEAINWNKPA